MKNIVLSIVIITNLNLFSQLPYRVSSFIEEYKDLINPIILTQNEIPFSMEGISINPPMFILGKEIDTIIFLENDFPILLIGNKKESNRNIFIPIFLPQKDDAPSSEEKDYSISYVITGDVGHRLIQVQWKNIIPEESIDNDFVNLQIIINENKNYVDFAYGPNSSVENILISLLKDELPVLIGIVKDAEEDDDISDLYYLSGIEDNPILFNEPEMEEVEQLPSILLTKYPQDGRVFRFSQNTSGANDITNENFLTIDWNKETKELKILNNEEKYHKYTLYNIQGQQIFKVQGNEKTTFVSIPQYLQGIYVLKITDDLGKYGIRKLLLN